MGMKCGELGPAPLSSPAQEKGQSAEEGTRCLRGRPRFRGQGGVYGDGKGPERLGEDQREGDVKRAEAGAAPSTLC